MAKKIKDEQSQLMERKPWIKKTKGLRIIAVVSLSLAFWVGYQIMRSENDWGSAILWGVIFGASTFLVYIGMNAFHSLFNKKQ